MHRSIYSEYKVLIVEDDSALNHLIQRTLEKQGFYTACALTGIDALNFADKHPNTILLIDYILPDMTASQIISGLKSRGELIPFIIMTGYDGENIAIQMMKFGAKDYLKKETDFLDLLPEVIKRVIDKIIIEKKLKQAEKKLRKSEEKFRLISENAIDLISVADPLGKRLYLSPSYEKVLDNPDTLIGTNIFTEVHPDDRKEIEIIFDKSIKSGFAQRIEYRMLNKSGAYGWFESQCSIIKDEKGAVINCIIVSRDITESIRAKEALKKSEESFRRLFQHVLIGIYRTTPSGKIIMANQAFTNMLGNKTLKDTLKIPHIRSTYTHPDERDIFEKLLQDKEFIKDFEHEIKRPDGSVRYVRETARLVKNKFGDVEYYEGTIEDITQRRDVENALIEAKEMAERSDKLKTDFLAQISHKIRTPLNTILSFTSLLKEQLKNKIDNELSVSFDTIDHAGTRIIRTIELILNMSEVQSGSYEFEPKDLDLYSDILENLYFEFKNRSEEKGVDLILKRINNNTKVIADEYSVNQIFVNLLDNAIKYTNRGSIEIDLNQNENGNITVTIADQGIRISEEYLPNLFKPFSQEYTGYSRRYDGNGLGLALVKKYCEMNRAGIEVQSIKGEGTKFKVSFPTNSFN